MKHPVGVFPRDIPEPTRATLDSELIYYKTPQEPKESVLALSLALGLNANVCLTCGDGRKLRRDRRYGSRTCVIHGDCGLACAFVSG